jgi:hypothetical protein
MDSHQAFLLMHWSLHQEPRERLLKGWFLIQLGLRQNYTQLCEAFQVRGQLLLSR